MISPLVDLRSSGTKTSLLVSHSMRRESSNLGATFGNGTGPTLVLRESTDATG